MTVAGPFFVCNQLKINNKKQLIIIKLIISIHKLYTFFALMTRSVGKVESCSEIIIHSNSLGAEAFQT